MSLNPPPPPPLSADASAYSHSVVLVLQQEQTRELRRLSCTRSRLGHKWCVFVIVNWHRTCDRIALSCLCCQRHFWNVSTCPCGLGFQAAVSALDMAASSVKLALETVHHYTLRQAAAFEEAVASPRRPHGSGTHSDSCACTTSPVSGCPCCSEGTTTSGQPDGSSRSHAPTSSQGWAQVNPFVVVYSAICAGMDGIVWLTSSAANGPTSNADSPTDPQETAVHVDRASVYKLDDDALADESINAA